MTSDVAIATLLKDRFGFSSFRAHQEDVCLAAVRGEHCLLVMPTGSGKSLCYQLPGLALGGTTLVISPLIALMEDQVTKMQARGLRAERIHAGRDREASRQVCLDYLNGKLDFLYVAPERFSVPRFPQMLAKKRPALVAVDEAHCISHWGHDFRPEYRKLGEHLDILAPTPIMAVTATATVMVQDDIVRQLKLKKAHRFIHGFRRANIGIEVIEMSPREREPAVIQLLLNEGRRPAIVYSPTRKACNSLAILLKERFTADAYHAGLPPAERDRIQAAFLEGNLDVIVATVAFGMGIDKPNVRTVIHTAMPSSLEAYYQEIGRAGRDGKTSRAILMHSYSDRKTHEFFLERDYPEPSVLKTIFQKTTKEALSMEALREKSGIEEDTFSRAVEKLWGHSGIDVDFEENVTRKSELWEKSYIAQRRHKTTQLDLVHVYTRAGGCRMTHLVRHFGDEEKETILCGLCDHCTPTSAYLQKFRGLTSFEEEATERLFDLLLKENGQTVGRLHQALFDSGGLDRRSFEDLLDGLCRSKKIRLKEDQFVKDDKVIRFQRVYLCGKGAASEIQIPLRSSPNGRRKKGPPKSKPQPALGPLEGEALNLFQRLRDWRRHEARDLNIPAFCILTDRVLRSISTEQPKTESELLAIQGFGPKLYEKHGDAILEIVNS